MGRKKLEAREEESVSAALVGVEGKSKMSENISAKEDDESTSKKQVSEDVVETSNNKKKKKKKGRITAQEEDEIDKILAELGEAPSISKPAPPLPEEKIKDPPEAKGGEGSKEVEEGRLVESAAAKKKKRKKEKEKEKKAAAEEKLEDTKNETKSKVPDKKVPKDVRAIQKRLAKMREAEERKKKEEEERSRKEEEEERRQEEVKRIAEEENRLKKEKEKAKLLKKKLEGKLLTGKQKEKALRREAMRKQILANAEGLPLPNADADASLAKQRPIYQKKKPKPQSQANSAAPAEPADISDSKESQQETASEMESKEIDKDVGIHAEVKPLDLDVVTKNAAEGEDDDEDWDAKSWDETDCRLPGKGGFADEEADTQSEPLVKREVKSTEPAAFKAVPTLAAPKLAVISRKITSTALPKSVNAESKKGGKEADVTEKNKHKELREKKRAPKSDSPSLQSESNLRAPICCIMGHVDAGKTKLLDSVRGTNVQKGEAGGITQQIGATYFPAENIQERAKELKANAKLSIPGLLVIDTPGHESFTNLRSRGSGLCDIAILVVDIMHVEIEKNPTMIESLNLLKMRNTEFVVALNKVDRLYGWKTCPNSPIIKAMEQQSKEVQITFNMKLSQVITLFKERGLNTELYYKNKKMGETFNIVPTSAISGEGIPDLLLLLVQRTQRTMAKKLTFSNEVHCTVLEVKAVEGLGTTIDVVLVNGVLHEGDQIVICGMKGPIVTTIQALLTPQPMKELRVKGTYLHHKEIKATQGIKITAQGLENAIAGTALHVVGPNADVEDVKEAAVDELRSVTSRIGKSHEGVCIQASSLGSLEALSEFLKSPEVNIPISGISIGPVHQKDVRTASVMLEKRKEYATILAFDVKVTPEAQELADRFGVKIICENIIYRLFDEFKRYIDKLNRERKRESAEEAVFPCVLKIIPGYIFNNKDPIILGVDILRGIAKVGTPICIPKKEFMDIGHIRKIMNGNTELVEAKKGQKVSIEIVSDTEKKMSGKHFRFEDELVSRISRRSIDILKQSYRDELNKDEWKLIEKLKKQFNIL